MISTTIKNSGKLLVVTYHYVRDSGGNFPGIHPISEDKLSRQIGSLAKKYHKATPNEVSKFVSGKSTLKRDSFFITFDDGLIDHYTTVPKVLKKHNINAAFFIPTRPLFELISPAVHKIHWLRSNIQPDKFYALLNELLPDKWSDFKLTKKDKERAKAMHIHDNKKNQELKFLLNFILPYDIVDKVSSIMINEVGMLESDFCKETFMSKKQIKSLHSDGNIIGMHGHSHVSLSSLNRNNLYNDISCNQKNLSSIINVIPKWLSYPYGRVDAIPNNTSSLCCENDIDAAFTLISGVNRYGDNHTKLKRITPNELHKFI